MINKINESFGKQLKEATTTRTKSLLEDLSTVDEIETFKEKELPQLTIDGVTYTIEIYPNDSGYIARWEDDTDNGFGYNNKGFVNVSNTARNMAIQKNGVAKIDDYVSVISSNDRPVSKKVEKAIIKKVFELKKNPVKEDFEYLNGEKVKVFADFNKAKAYAESKGLKESEYGDYYKDYAYCCWNKSGNRNDTEEVIAYYKWDENGKPKELSMEDKERINKYNDAGDIFKPLKEGWAHFTYKSGANPYIAKTEIEKERILRKYGNKVKEVKKDFYEIDDTKKDDFMTESGSNVPFKKVEMKLPNDWVIAKYKNKYALMSQREFDSASKNPDKWFKEWTIDLFPTKKALIQSFKREPYYKHIFDGIELKESNTQYPEFPALGKWEWDEVKQDWYDTRRHMYYTEIVRNSSVDEDDPDEAYSKYVKESVPKGTRKVTDYQSLRENTKTVNDAINEFVSRYGNFIDSETKERALKDMSKAKTYWDAVDIGSIYTNLNFYRFKDNNEIVGHAGVHPSKNKSDLVYTLKDREYNSEKERDLTKMYFDIELAKPYIDKIFNKKSTLKEGKGYICFLITLKDKNGKEYYEQESMSADIFLNIQSSKEGPSLKEYFQQYYDDEVISVEQNGYLKEDTIKQGNSWVNKGKEGTHGKFKTKKQADAQRKAMFAQGYKAEALEDKLEKKTYVVMDANGKTIDKFEKITQAKECAKKNKGSKIQQRFEYKSTI